jgi:hypothetical protein
VAQISQKNARRTQYRRSIIWSTTYYEEKCWNPDRTGGDHCEGRHALRGIAQEVDELAQQCEYIWDIREDRSALQRELDLLLGQSPDALSCRFDTPPELREACEEQCIGLIVSLLGETPVAELPEPPDAYN